MSEDDLKVDLEVNDDVAEADDLSGVPVLPLRDVVVYPHMVIPLFVGREKSIVALDRAMNAGKKILLIAQQKADLDDPAARGSVRSWHAGNDIAVAEAARWHRQSIGRRGRTRLGRQYYGRRSFLSRNYDPWRRGSARRTRDRCAGAFDHCAVRAVRKTEQESSARDPDFIVRYR